MTKAARSEAISVLRRFVHGQLSFDELQGFVRSRNFGWLDELLDGLELTDGDYRELALDEHALGQRLQRFVGGSVSAHSFADWAFETYRIFSSGAYPTSEVYSAKVEISLLMLCLVSECAANGLLAPPAPRAREIGGGSVTQVRRTGVATDPRRIAGRILDALERGQQIPAEGVVGRVLRNLPTVRLQTRARPKEDHFAPELDQWVDLALATTHADRPVPAPEECWFVPLAVCTRELWLENPPEGVWGHPENDRMHALRGRFPHLDLDEGDPLYFVGPDGIAEIVLATPVIDEFAVRTAVRLFCLRNRIRRCTLDRSPCYPSKEDR